MTSASYKLGIWQRAIEMSRATPESRNRYVDFLRAVAILCVIFGHWTAAAAYPDGEGGLKITHLLEVTTKSHPFTWLIQVMPVFFFVGGFSNGVSWSAAKRKGTGYSIWLESRLRRLIAPVLVPLAAWIVMGGVAHLCGVSRPWIGTGSQLSLIPIWFLAVYLVIALLVPISHALWSRFGWLSFFGLAAIGGALDAGFFLCDLRNLAWVNYIFIWSAVHQLGYAWNDKQLEGKFRPLMLAGIGGALLCTLVFAGPYPLSMVSVSGDPVSNTLPPKITLLCLGCLQIGLLLSIQAPMKRFLSSVKPWAVTVLINGMIMTVFLWHMTVMILFVGAAHLMGDLGLGAIPNSPEWWWQKAIWLVVCTLGLLPAIALFGRFERPKAQLPGLAPLPAWRLAIGSILVCFGLALVAFSGISGDGPLGLRTLALLPPFLGAALTRRWGTERAPA